jgi:hypothetical protein
MKKGFEIQIQKNLSPEERAKAVEYANKFIKDTCGHPTMNYLGMEKMGGYTTGLWRGRFGMNIWNDLVFRRISKNKRAFGIVKQDTLEVHNDKPLNRVDYLRGGGEPTPNGPVPNNMCNCPTHKGALKVRFKTRPEMEVYARIGDVKG